VANGGKSIFIDRQPGEYAVTIDKHVAQPVTQGMTDLSHESGRPLAGVRVLELCPPSAGIVGRLLAELGADVISVPQSALPDDPLSALVGSTSKRIVNCPIEGSRLETLAKTADIVLQTRLDSAAPDLVAGMPILRADNPKAVIVSISPFGQDHAQSHWQLTSSILDALTGVLARSGFPEKDPLLPPAELALQCAYAQSAWITLVSYFNRLRTGEGDLVELSLLEAAAQSMDPGFAIAGSATAGVPASQLPRGRPEARHQYPLISCQDGFVRICILAPRQWQGMFAWMGSPEKYADPAFNRVHHRFATPSLIPDIAAFFADKTRAELEEEAGRFGVPLAPVLTLEESLATDHVAARGALATVHDERGRAVRLPNGVFELDGARAGIAEPQYVGAEAGWLEAERFDPAPELARPERPLSGYTLIDFGVIVAGAEQSRLLADQGALTLKVETAAFPDGGRVSKDGLTVSVNFALGHRNKKGLGLNLRDPRGKALLVDLARQADIIMSNFRPGTLTSLGLDYPVLSAANPSIVMTDSSAYGPSGPWSRRAGYGPLVRASSGLTHQYVYAGTSGQFSDGMMVYPDHVSGILCATATLAQLVRRLRTGRGGTVSLSQAEVITSHLADRVGALGVGEQRPPRPDAPWDVYPCAGDDEWCAVTVRNDADWRALAQAIGRNDWLADAGLATSEGRIGRREELDAALTAWTESLPSSDVMERLQNAGVPAGRMLRVFELPEFTHFQERHTFRKTRHPHIPGDFLMQNALARSEKLKLPDDAPAPVPGEHTEWVARTLLGLDEAQIRTLEAEGVLETWKVPA
jgi:crotonobetainyl-CoA:carnitine CoA-transferase CaiB-like acyl-CoA transferase